MNDFSLHTMNTHTMHMSYKRNTITPTHIHINLYIHTKNSLTLTNEDGLLDGALVGEPLGPEDGFKLGIVDGTVLGLSLGISDGSPLGLSLGRSDGDKDGIPLGSDEGLACGKALGNSLGIPVGTNELEGPQEWNLLGFDETEGNSLGHDDGSFDGC